MKKSNSIHKQFIVIGISSMLFSCGSGKTANQEEKAHEHDHSEMDHSADHKMTEGSEMSMSETKTIAHLIDNYLLIKDALVNDDSKAAAIAGQKLANASLRLDISSVDNSKQSEVKEILEVLVANGVHIAEKEIDLQREHFESIGKDFMDLLEIAGTDRTLYQQYCPMYAKGKGGSWLSASSEIRNPLFGSKMLTCGSVKETISMN